MTYQEKQQRSDFLRHRYQRDKNRRYQQYQAEMAKNWGKKPKGRKASPRRFGMTKKEGWAELRKIFATAAVSIPALFWFLAL